MVPLWGSVDSQPCLVVIVAQLLDPGLEGTDVPTLLDTGPNAAIQLLDLTLELVFAVDQLGSCRLGVETEQTSDHLQHRHHLRSVTHPGPSTVATVDCRR